MQSGRFENFYWLKVRVCGARVGFADPEAHTSNSVKRDII